MSNNNDILMNLNARENVEKIKIDAKENEFDLNFDESEKKKNRSKIHLFFSLSKRVPKGL